MRTAKAGASSTASVQRGYRKAPQQSTACRRCHRTLRPKYANAVVEKAADNTLSLTTNLIEQTGEQQGGQERKDGMHAVVPDQDGRVRPNEAQR